jgi:hypothetical protein
VGAGYPLQYNLLKIADNQLTVYTRRREELNGAWKPMHAGFRVQGKHPWIIMKFRSVEDN